MRRFHFQLIPLCTGVVGALFVVYIGLVAVVMTYALLTVEFSQSVRTDESAVALLESQYLSSIARITNTDYAAEGYAIPVIKLFVPTTRVTALR